MSQAPSKWIVRICVAAGLALLCGSSGFAEDVKSPVAYSRAEHLVRMKKIASSIDVYPTAKREARVELLGGPVLRYSDNTRQLDESSLWIWGASGRPCAIV